MIPPRDHPIWELLVTGQKKLKSVNSAFNMFIFNCKLRLEKDNSETVLHEATDNAYTFFTKYEKMLQPELQQLIGRH